MQFSEEHLDPLFVTGKGKKLAQFREAGCLPEEVRSDEALVGHVLHLLQSLHPVLAEVLNAELLAGNRVSTVFGWPGGPFCVGLLRPFSKRYKGKQLERSAGKDPHYGAGYPAFEQYFTPLAPGQYLAADEK